MPSSVCLLIWIFKVALRLHEVFPVYETERGSVRASIHPSSMPFILEGLLGAGANLTCHWARIRAHPGQIASLLQQWQNVY